jgi:hypothetical protein
MEVLVFKSDQIQVTQNLERHVEVRYTNDRDFAGIIYSGDTVPVFRIYVEAMFFKERYQEELETENADENVLKLLAAVKYQKKLEVEPVPYYMAKILKLALNHSEVYIDGVRYVKEEEITMRNMNDAFPFEPLEVWLTEYGKRKINVKS